MIKTINSTKFRAHFKETMDYVKKSKMPLIITERDAPTVILIDIDEYEDVLSAKNKAFVASIKKARAEYSRGDVLTMNDVFADII